MGFTDIRLAVFAREPVSGKVKTRLVPALGEEGALNLYLQLLERFFNILDGFIPASVELWIDGSLDHDAFSKFDGPRYQQAEGDLGRRMDVAIADILGRADGVIIVGTDCPAMGKDYLQQAVNALKSNADVVLGPAKDGGYVLIGMRCRLKFLFEGIDWGSETVLAETVNKLRAEKISFQLLPELADIDRPEDLESLVEYGVFPQISRQLVS